MSSPYENDSIFWVEVDRIYPNPYQPRKEFDEKRLSELAESIRQYGVLQPLVVTRRETEKEDGGIAVEYELVAGERRLRASKIAGLFQVPVVIRTAEESNQMKLELAIIENLQREDLSPLDRAQAFNQLVTEFKFTHTSIAKKVGKSREYVSNSLRLLLLPAYIQEGLAQGSITEGHTRPLLMLSDRQQEQDTLYREILLKKLTVRESERIARSIAVERSRKKVRGYDPDIVGLEQELTESLGTRVQIESKEVGGKIMIDFFSNDDLRELLRVLNAKADSVERSVDLDTTAENSPGFDDEPALVEDDIQNEEMEGTNDTNVQDDTVSNGTSSDDEEGDDLYSIRNFSV